MKNNTSINRNLVFIKTAGMLFMLAVLMVHCKKSDPAPSPGPNTNKPADSTNVSLLDLAPDTVKLSKHIQPIFTANCAITGCHAGTSPKSGLNLENSKSWASLKAKTAIENAAADPTSVKLYIKMTYPNGIMPPTGKLPLKYTNLVYQWLKKGAKNN
jgi:hypothetical protein